MSEEETVSTIVATREKKYRQAAVTYLVYGLTYWLGGWYLIEAGVSEQSGTAWLIIGAVILLVFPPLIWKGFTWFTRILALLVGVRIVGLVRVIVNDEGAMVPLPWGSAVPMVAGALVFMGVAAVACAMLVRASWDLGKREPTEEEA